MTSLITGTWTLISSSAQLVAGARRMTLRIHSLLQPGLLELSDGDRRRLLALQKRVDCLVQPLNFLLLWSKQRDSCIQQAVLSAQDLLSDVCDFVDKYFPQDGGGGLGPGGAGAGAKASAGTACAIDSDQLEYYLRELEFACASVSMAINMSRIVDLDNPGGAPQGQLPPPPGEASAAGGPASSSASCAGGLGRVSLSALLRASRRIQEMSGCSGDLCASPGRLYTQAPSSSVGDARRGSSEVEGGGGDVAWVPLMTLAAFKVVAASDGRFRRRRFGLSVESRLPLGSREELADGDPGGALGGSEDASSSSIVAGLNTSGPLDFPIEVALDARLVTMGFLGVPSDPSRCDLGVDELALVWTAAPGARQGIGSGCSLSDEFGGEPIEVVLLPDMCEQGPRPLWERGPRRASSPRGALPRTTSESGSLGGGAGSGGTKFAFVFDGRRGASDSYGEQEMKLSPLDSLYLARLCAYDDAQRSPDGAGCPPHVLGSDETLAALLQQREVAPEVAADATVTAQRSGVGKPKSGGQRSGAARQT